MEYFPNIKPKRKGKSALTYLDDSDVGIDSEGSEIREETHRSLRSTLNGHRRPLSAESSNFSSVGLRRSEVGLLELRMVKILYFEAQVLRVRKLAIHSNLQNEKYRL